MTSLESAEEFHARVAAATDDEGRLPVAIELMPGWDIFPFELRGSTLLDWEENLPTVPEDVRRANASHIADRLFAKLGGTGPAWTA